MKNTVAVNAPPSLRWSSCKFSVPSCKPNKNRLSVLGSPFSDKCKTSYKCQMQVASPKVKKKSNSVILIKLQVRISIFT